MRIWAMGAPLALVMAAGAGPALAQAPGAQADAPYESYQLESRYVEGEGGTRLAVDIYKPMRGGVVAGGRLPVVLMHSRGQRPAAPFGDPQRTLRDRQALALLAAGYVVAWMEPRGIGASFGVNRGFLTAKNGRDAARVVDWLGEQPWSNGNVGMAGISNMGFIQSLTAVERPRHLRAIAPAVSNPDIYYQLYPNGVSAMAGAPGTGAAPAPPPPAPVPVDEDSQPGHPLLQQALAERIGGFDLTGEWVPNMLRDQVNPVAGYAPGLSSAPIERLSAIAQAGIAVYQMGGWYDSSVPGQLTAYNMLGGKVIVGAWHHRLTAEDQGGPLLRSELVRWFDLHLKGRDDGIASEPPVRYQLRNARDGEGWRRAAHWPLPSQQPMTLHFGGANGQEAVSLNNGLLTDNRPAGRSRDEFRLNTQIAAFDGTFNRLFKNWDGDMRPSVDSKALTYTGEPLAADMEVTGHPVMHLWVSSTATDGDFIVYLEAVDEDGTSRFVTDGSMRASHRKLAAREPWSGMGVPFHRSFAEDIAPLEPGEPAELTFALNATSYLFRKGQRIRISIVGGDANAYQQPAAIDPANPPLVSVYRGVLDSRIDLPIVQAGSNLFAGQVQGHDASGPAQLYVSDDALFLHWQDQWRRCPAGTGGYDCPGLGRAQLAMDRSADRPWRVTVSGAEWRFEGEGQ